MKSLYKEDDQMVVVFSKGAKTLTASLFSTGETDFEVMIETKITKIFDFAEDTDFPNTHINVQEFSEKLLNVQNNLELEKIIEEDKNLLKFKSFINEYALIYMTYTEKTLALFSIFLDLEHKRYRQVNVFATPNGYKDLSFRQEGNSACIYDGSQMLAQAHIYTRDLSPTYALKFSNGSTGTGAWNLTNMFKQV